MLKESLLEWVYETPAGKVRPRETPHAQRRRGWTTRGKRVPYVPINGHILKA
ncbi:hypothetical protein SRABI96_00290 [Peribacillus sp. Bi96]|nr:hypothetical protein SRABI96_00290 [Peribacillus sp. Bi96]